jgi:hypothetical protein
VPLPDPLLPDVMVVHEVGHDVVQLAGVQPVGLAVTLTCPAPPLAPTLADVGEMANVQGEDVEAAAWVMVTDCPATVMTADRLEPVLAVAL